MQPRAQPFPGQAGRRQRRSEVDRRLDSLTGPSGRLKDPNAGNIIRVLRLFNLCDVDPLPTQSPPKGARAAHSPPQSVSAPVKEDGPEAAADHAAADHAMPADAPASVRALLGEPAELQGPEEPSARLPLEPSAVPQVHSKPFYMSIHQSIEARPRCMLCRSYYAYASAGCLYI